MSVGTICATIPAVVAAAVGIYSFERHSGAREFGGGIRSSIGGLLAKPNQKVKTTPVIGGLLAKTNQKVKTTPVLPKVAPQFDGLNCFETLVGC